MKRVKYVSKFFAVLASQAVHFDSSPATLRNWWKWTEKVIFASKYYKCIIIWSLMRIQLEIKCGGSVEQERGRVKIRNWGIFWGSESLTGNQIRWTRQSTWARKSYLHTYQLLPYPTWCWSIKCTSPQVKFPKKRLL